MRQPTTAIRGELAKNLGTEPLLMVEVEWVDGARVAYADRKINGEEYPYPFIVSMGQFNTSTVIGGSSDSQTINITFNDIDGSIKTLLNTVDIHKRPVYVYLLFAGLPVTEKMLLFNGVINSPMVWDEGSRTFSMEVLSQLESREVAFSMDDSDGFPFVPPQDRNNVWPLVFGTVCNMAVNSITALRKGFLASGQGVMDPTIPHRLCQAQKLKCPARPIEPAEQAPVGSTLNVNAGKVDQNCLTRRFNEICAILHEQEQESQYVQTTMTIRGGADFPQNTLIDIRIRGVRFTGTMSGETFTVTQVYHPDLDEIDNPPCKDIPEAAIGTRYKRNGATPQQPEDCDDASGYTPSEGIVGGGGESWRYYQDFEKSRFIWLPPGSDVFLDNESEIIHIVSLIPGTVNQVAAYRTFGDTSLLVEVPTDYYTVHTVDYGGYEVVEVRLHKPLSQVKDEDWDEDIFVSFTSDVGPNPVDVIEWVVEKYTDLTIDATSFASVHASMANYPTNFYVKTRLTALELIQQIAYQTRCAAIVRNNIISLVYLSKEPTSVRTITESDIVANSFQVTDTETEDLVTRHTISWREADAAVDRDDDVDREFTIKHNIPKYGVSDDEIDYFTQNVFSTILKSATFWMIRKSNTWKFVEFETALKHLDLESFDCITLSIAQFPTVKCVIEEASYNADSNTIRFKCWTPILAGTNSPYLWAWPALQDAAAVFPLIDSDQSGNGYDFIVTPPEGHPLLGGFDEENTAVWTDGDRHPSDLDDTFPTITCQVATGAEIAPDLEPDLTPFEPVANDNFNDNLDQIASGGVSQGEDEDKEERPCGDPGGSGTGCIYEVKVRYITPSAIAPFREDVGTFAGPCTGQTGRPCFGPEYIQCHTFGAYFAATLFASQKAAEAAHLWTNGLYQVGKTDVAPAGVSGGITGFPGEGPFGECEETSNPDNPLNDAGETNQPGCASGDCP